MSFLKNIGNMPVPSWARIDKQNNVFHKQKTTTGWRKYVIGKVVKELSPHGHKMMMPNENMRKHYADEFDSYYGEGSSLNKQLIAGPYAVSLRLSSTSGLYQSVQTAFGAETGNALMDYALMSFVIQSSAAYRIDNFVDLHAHYSLSSVTSSTLSNTLSTLESHKIHCFKLQWLNEYKANNHLKEVWLSIDGTNHDNNAVGSALAAQGKSKSGNTANIINQIWAVDTNTGIPVTWYVNEGNVTDNKAFDAIINFLGASDIKVKGVLLDRGFATDEIMSLIESYGYEYVIMLRSGCNGYDAMFQSHSNEIRRLVVNRIGNGGLYGITDEVTVFKNTQRKTRVGLFFSSINADERAEHFSDKVANEIDSLKQAIDNKALHVRPKDEFAHIIRVTHDEHGVATGLSIDYSKWQKNCDSKGYFAIATSVNASAKELYELYCLRDTSEKVFAELKSQLGFDTLRGHTDSSISARIAVSFIASVLRQMFINHCNKIGAKPNPLIDKLCKVTIDDTANGVFVACNAAGRLVSKLFDSIGLTKVDITDIATQIGSLREGQVLSQFRTLNSLLRDNIHTASSRHFISSRQPNDGVEVQAKKRVGRPKGRKNNSTLERELKEASELSVASTSTERRKPGRPKGSKNKQTLEREKAQAIEQVMACDSSVKRSPGRPKGRKNNKTIAKELGINVEELTASQSAPKRGRGRPKGSLNKKTIAYQEKIAAEIEKEKRKPGRPKGSRNKKTTSLNDS